MRTDSVRVHSCVDGHVLRHVSEREARLMCGEDSFGDRLEECDAVARRLSRKKQKLTDIQLLTPARAERNSACTLTLSDTQNNAFGQHFKALGSTDSIRAIDRAIDKIAMWPYVHDDRTVIISAGVVHGVVEMETIPQY